MVYQISYEDGWAATDVAPEQGATRTEYFRTEHDASIERASWSRAGFITALQ